jgi:hypothetical protein
MATASHHAVPDPRFRAFCRQGLTALQQSGVPFLVGGAYALKHYTGVERHTKDLDIFIYPQDCERALQTFSAAGYQTDLIFPHWLAKAFCGDTFIDVIFNSGNGLCQVDDKWFEHAVEGELLNLSLLLCPPEEMIWSKAFVEERERYDGADIAHILRARGAHLAWSRLLQRFGTHWRVLLSHLILFGFIYPSEHAQIPEWVMQELVDRLQHELRTCPPAERVCRGTILSRAQYLVDVAEWGYQDARLLPKGSLTTAAIAHWTAAIKGK